ncbi:MAG: VOC family protein [Chitinophagales bacterium]|nr:VOC family protein [Chitinophagales bacterium]
MKPTFTQIKETCLYVADLQRTREFYEGKLGLECFALSESRHAFFRAGSSVLLCFIAEATKTDTKLPPHFGTGQQHFAFETEVQHYRAWKQWVADAGIAIEQEVDWPQGGKSFYFRDPDGNLAEIVMKGIWGI